MAVVQAVIIYGSETEVMTPRMRGGLDGFHPRVDCRLTERQPWILWYGGWVDPLLEEALAEAGLQEVETYVSQCQNKVAQFIATRPIMDLYLAAAQRLGSSVAKRWW